MNLRLIKRLSKHIIYHKNSLLHAFRFKFSNRNASASASHIKFIRNIGLGEESVWKASLFSKNITL